MADLPSRADLRSALIMEDGQTRFGDAMADFQRADFAAMDGAPTKHVYIERGRGGSKSSDLSAEAAVTLLVKPGARIVCAAADLAQAQILHEKTLGWITRTPGLRDAVSVTRTTIEVPEHDARLEAIPADAPGTWGLSPSDIYADEFTEWPPGAAPFWYALLSSAPKKRARICIISSPGVERHGFAYDVRELARRRPDRWLFSQLTTPIPWLDPADVAEQQEMLPEAEFRRLFGGAWPTEGPGFLPPEKVDACFLLRSVPVPSRVAVCVGVDIGLTRDSAVVAAVAWENHTRYHVLALETFRPTRTAPVDLLAMKATLREMMQRYRAAAWVDPFQGELLAAELRAEGLSITTVPITAEARWEMYMRLCRAVQTDCFRCFPHEMLRRELLSLTVASTPGGMARIDHRYGMHDDHVFAVILAMHGLHERYGKPRPVYVGVSR